MNNPQPDKNINREDLLLSLSKQHQAQPISNVAVGNDSYVFIALNDDEILSAKRSTLFDQLEVCDIDFLSLYKPHDIATEYFTKTLEFIQSLDDPYHKCRFIQMFIDFERYIDDMLTPIEGKEPICFFGEINSYKEGQFTVFQIPRQHNKEVSK